MPKLLILRQWFRIREWEDQPLNHGGHRGSQGKAQLGDDINGLELGFGAVLDYA
jgi:hypothetical protein